MHRRAFLFGTAALAAGAGASRAGTADTLAMPLSDLRGSLPESDAALRPGAVDDQSAAMQAAIDRAAADGRPLFLPPGRYEVSNITLADGLTLVGVPGRTVLVYTGGGHLIEAVHARGVGLDGIVLDGANRALADYASGLVQFLDVADAALDRVEVMGSARMAVALERVSGRVSRSRLAGARQAGLWSVDAAGLSVTDTVVEECGDGGILVSRWEAGDDGTLVTGCRVERIRAAGTAAQSGSGITLTRAAGVILANNRIVDCAASAIRLDAAANVQVTGNSCLRSGGAALASRLGCEGAMVAQNVIDGAAAGIALSTFESGGRLAVVSGNLVRSIGTTAAAASASGAPDDPRVPAGIAIAVEADTAVSGNVIDDAADAGIRVGWGPSLRDVSATGNVIRRARIGVAVSVVDGAGSSVITDNLMSGLKEGGVRGMRWATAVTGDIALAGDPALTHLTIRGNKVA